VALRVIQWATGPVGSVLLREVIARPDLELVGVRVYGPDKAGRDAGELIGAPPTGVVATDDRSAILALDADIVLHAASKSYGFEANTDDIVALLESGKTVITTTSYAHLPTLGGGVDQRIRQACEKGRARFFGTGEHPGFVVERLAATLTGVCQRVDRIIMRQFVDVSHVPEKRMLVDLMGMGKRPDEISDASPAFRSVSTQSEQALGAAAEVLGLRVDEMRHSIRTATIDRDLELPAATLPAGSVVGQALSWSAYRDGQPVLTCEDYWTCTDDIPGWDTLKGHTIRIEVHGAPNMTLDFTVDIGGVPELGGASGGYVMVAMAAIRAIPDVMAAPPGVVFPKVFGAYRFDAFSRA
jgi:hypothetical protein